jgi:hypothetical protein
LTLSSWWLRLEREGGVYHISEVEEGRGEGDDEQVETIQVLPPDAFGDPRAVMVVSFYANVASVAVEDFLRLEDLARLAVPTYQQIDFIFGSSFS